MVHGHIHGELSKAAVNEFRGHLEIIGDFPALPRGASYAWLVRGPIRQK
jgi:hypothetical protein